MFRRVLAFLAIAAVLVSQAAGQQAPPFSGKAKVERGTTLSFIILEALDSTTANVGDDVPLRLARPLVVDGVVLLPAGEVVHGKVTKVYHAGPKGLNGAVEWKLKRIRFADGSTAKVTAGYLDEFTKWQTFELIAIYGVIFAPLIPFYLLNLAFGGHANQAPQNLAHGKKFLLPANSTVAVTVTQDHRVRF